MSRPIVTPLTEVRRQRTVLPDFLRFSNKNSKLFLFPQMDLVESTLFTPPIVLLQTVIEEVRHRSLPLYNRLKALIKMDEKRIWVFYNEYRSCVLFLISFVRSRVYDSVCRETAIIREEGETPNDRNDRGIRKATAWYNSHIGLTHPPIRGQAPRKLPTVVLMTEDAENRQKAEKAGIACVSGMRFCPFLGVKLNRRMIQCEHMSRE